MSATNPLLLIMIVVPLVGALVLAFLRGAPPKVVKLIGFAFSLVVFVLAIVLWIDYRSFQESGSTAPFASVISFDWIPAFGIRFSLGVDGFSLVMIALIAVLVPVVLGASWEEKLPAGRTIGGYFALLLTLQAAMIGVFAATDVFLFYVFFELMLIPMYFLIGAYGGLQRAYAATKFFLYSLLGGLMMLAGLIGLYVASSDLLPAGGTFDWATLRSIAHQIPESTQMWIFAGFAIAFAIKAPLVPFHTWLPDAGAEAPAGSGTLLVGVLDKVGTFGFLRICLPLLPAASSKLAWLLILLAVVGIFYGSIVAAGQSDLKRFVTFTSIAHFGFIVMGIFVFTSQSISGAVLYMVNHGLATGLLFLVVGMLVARGGSRLVGDYGGVWKVAPILGGVFLIASMASIALPGTGSFISEFLVLIGTFSRYITWGVIATLGIILAAVYMLWIFQQVFTGPIRGAAVVDGDGGADGEQVPVTVGGPAADDAADGAHAVAASGHPAGHGHGAAPAVRTRFGDLKAREIAVVTPLVVLIIFLGLYPKPVLDVINPTTAVTMVDSGHVDPVPALEGGN